MPKVGKMKFPYTEQGMKDAANYAKQTGKSMEMENGGIIPQYGHGGMVKPMMPKYAGGGMVMNPAQKMAMANRIAKMMHGGKVKKGKK
tara:strand:- start:913 stop:1176 length:264 start_codon:yes stop_codon:yes gene_type:complete